jgi:hypothetical protein
MEHLVAKGAISITVEGKTTVTDSSMDYRSKKSECSADDVVSSGPAHRGKV